MLLAILGNKVVATLATILHTGGAIAYLGGIGVMLSWVHHIRRGDHQPSVLGLGAMLTYLGILGNLVGGFARTYQPGHPSLTAFFDEPWVVLMAIKHLFLFAGIFLAAYLFEVIAPRLRRAHETGTLAQVPERPEKVAFGVIFVSILVASVLGGATILTPPSAHASVADDGGLPVFDLEPVTVTKQASGTLTSLPPVSAASATGSFSVPTGGLSLHATVSWSDAAATFTVTLVAPDGDEISQGATATAERPAPGEWGYRIDASNAVNAAWALEIDVTSTADGVSDLEGTETIAPGEIFEINTVARLGGTLAWHWDADRTLAFNVHTHFGDVAYLAQSEGRQDEGDLRVACEGGHSYMWENTGDVAVVLDYHVQGHFTVDSYYPAR